MNEQQSANEHQENAADQAAQPNGGTNGSPVSASSGSPESYMKHFAQLTLMFNAISALVAVFTLIVVALVEVQDSRRTLSPLVFWSLTGLILAGLAAAGTGIIILTCQAIKRSNELSD